MNDDQKMIERIYGERDRKRGAFKTFLWLVEEVGELAEALRKNSREDIEEEIADTYAWLLSLCNVLNIDLEIVFKDKYPGICPRCKKEVCECPEE